MIKYFYCTRNIVGLILVISPLAGFLYIDYSFTLSMIFFCALTVGVLLGSACYELIHFRLWTCFASIAACIGALLLHSDDILYSDEVIRIIGIASIGLYAGGLAVIVPANLLISWFRVSKTLLMGIVFSISIILGRFIGIFVERYTYPALALSLVLMITGTVFFLQRPPQFFSAALLCDDSLFKSVKRPAVIKLFIFVLAVSFTTGLSFFSQDDTQTFAFFISNEDVFILGLAAGALGAGLLSEFKGAYSGCILMIFLAELTVFSFGERSFALYTYIVSFSQGLFLSAMMTVIPITVYYIYGPGGYNRCLSKVWAAYPLGLSAGGTVYALTAGISDDGFFSPQAAQACLMILLIACFFTIFSTWKHRFVILKRS